MRKFLRIACSFSAGILFSVCICGTGCSASGAHDLNGDGMVNIADAVIISQFLIGDYIYSGNLTDLDFSGNYVIDDVDYDMFMFYLSGA